VGRPRNLQWDGAAWHGTANGYSFHKCRCEPCVKANAAHQMEMTKQRAARGVPDHVHGTAGGYRNYLCRCDACRAAYREQQHSMYLRRMQHA
jgi:hypothetical protein